MPPESRDAPEDLPKERRCQVAFGELEDEVPSVPNEAATGLEQPLLEAREGPALDGDRQDQPTQQIAEVVGDHPEEQPDLVGSEAVAREARPMGGFLAFLDPLLGRPALVVEVDDGAIRPGQGGDNEAHPRKEFPEMMLDLGDHSSRSVPGGGLVVEAAVPDQRRVARPAAGPSEQIFNGPLQDIIGRQPNRVPHPPAFQRLVEGRQRKGRVRPNDDGLALRWSGDVSYVFVALSAALAAYGLLNAGAVAGGAWFGPILRPRPPVLAREGGQCA